ncbi:hypothetical protein HHK36_028131 [Tetracentron sinense]|uniref:Pectinesterase inhibitor domain-containing protein n=1 Tax=Tetracentron sinense TaxID=13715 RepID=A0A834YJD5_TETSI|nr:hypothetical protein HHK36_028131 [Tetracentron sinense]
MTVKGYFPFSLLFSLSLLLFFSGATPVNLVYETCKKSSQEDPNVSYSFCVASLLAVPKSKHASLRGLGFISMNLTKSNATNIHLYIKKLLKHKKFDPFEKNCLSDCLDLYSDAIDLMDDAINSFKSKHYFDANIQVSAALDVPSTCEDGFKEKKIRVSPLTKINGNMFQLSALDLSIIEMVRR